MTTLSGDSPLPALATAFLEFQPGVFRLGDVLIRHGYCTIDDVSFALDRQKSAGRKLGELLVMEGRCTQAQIDEALAAQSLAAHPIWHALEHLTWHPELRTSRISEGTAAHVVAGIPLLGTYMRFDPAEFSIATAIANSASYAEVLETAWREAGLLVPPAQVADLAWRLWEAGLLQDPAGVHLAPRRRRSGFDWLVWRLPVVDPSPLLKALAPVLARTSTIPFVAAVWLPLALAALALCALRWPEVMREVQSLSSQYDSLHLGRIYLLLFFSLAVHEFGHAAVCSALGGSVRQLGVMLFVGMPFGYCDTSEAHRLTLKARIAVNLGGLYYQLGLAAAAMLAWAWAPMPDGIRTLALDLAIISAVAGAFNLIPFARLDGYYMVADLLAIPDLQGRAFSYIGHKLLGRPTEPLAPNEARILTVYGLMGMATVALLAVLAFRFWGKHLGL